MASSVKLYSTKEAQDILQVAQRTLYVYLESGALKAVKVGKFWRIPQDALDAFLAAGAPVQDKNRRKRNQAAKVMTGQEIMDADAGQDAGRTWRVKAHMGNGAWTHDFCMDATLEELQRALAACGLPFAGSLEFSFYHLAGPGQGGCAADTVQAGQDAEPVQGAE